MKMMSDERPRYAVVPLGNGKNAAVFIGEATVARGRIRQWCVDTGHASHAAKLNVYTGELTLTTKWCNHPDGLSVRAILDLRHQERKDWPANAQGLCETLETELAEVFEECEMANAHIGQRDVEIRDLKSRLAESERRAQAAEAAAEEMKRRARAVDPDRLRREITAELAGETAKVAEENHRLAAELHEARSQAAKLAEDKKRLRSALNTARSR